MDVALGCRSSFLPPHETEDLKQDAFAEGQTMGKHSPGSTFFHSEKAKRMTDGNIHGESTWMNSGKAGTEDRLMFMPRVCKAMNYQRMNHSEQRLKG